MSGIAVNYKNIYSGSDLKNNYKDFPMKPRSNWKVIDLSSPEEIAQTFKNSRKYFYHDESYTKIPYVKEIFKRSLKDQFISGIGFFAELTERTPLGVLEFPILLFEQHSKEKKFANLNDISFEKIIKGDLTNISHNFPSSEELLAKQMFDEFHDYFVSYLKKIDKEEPRSKIFCPISKDIIIIPVKTNCGHVYELIYLTNALKESRNCQVCDENINEAYFDFPTWKAINDVLNETLVGLEKASKSQPLYCIIKEYSNNHMRITQYIKKTIGLMIQDNYQDDNINLEQFSEKNKKLKDWV